MARPFKDGLDYFTADVDLFEDPKIFKLLNRFGTNGFAIYWCLLCMIYANGYYLEFDPDVHPAQIIKQLGNRWIRSEKVVLQVVHFGADIGLFDLALLQENIITSVRIQERFRDATVRRRRDMSKYCILKDVVLSEPNETVNSNNNSINVDNNSVNDVITTTKGKESIYICSERIPNSQNSLEIPLKDGTYFSISDDVMNQLASAYKDIDIKAELHKMILWCDANPSKRKTRKGIMRFITNWLSRIKPTAGGKNEYPNL